MNHNPETWGQDAHHFNPARYLDPSTGKVKQAPAGARVEPHVFGFGRRICPGRHVADDIMFIFIAVLLWALNIERKRNHDGTVTPLDADGSVDDGVVV